MPRFVLLEKNNRGLHRKARKHRHESKDRMRRNSVKKKRTFFKGRLSSEELKKYLLLNSMNCKARSYSLAEPKMNMTTRLHHYEG